jgi:hypothetical protein
MLRKLMPLLVVVAIAGGALIPGIASAVQPEREDLPFDEPIILSGDCPFDVEVAPLSSGQTITTFFNRQLITGFLKVRVTNLDTGESLDLNISGPGRFLIDEDSATLIQQGPWFTRVEPGTFEDDPEFAGLFLTKGKVVSEFDPDTGAFLGYVSFQGSVEDLCAALSN